jgi:hypothetical protein
MAAGGAGGSSSLLDLFERADQTIRENASLHKFGESVLPEIRLKYPYLLPMVDERATKEGHPSCDEKDIGKHKTPVFIGVSRFARVVRPAGVKPINSVWVEIPIEAGYRCSIVESSEKAMCDGRDGYVCFLADTDLLLVDSEIGRFTYECDRNEKGYLYHYGFVRSEKGESVRLEIDSNNLYLRDALMPNALVTSDNDAEAEAGAGAGKAKATKPKTPRAGGAGAGPPLPRKRTRTRRQKHRTRRRRN